jgi:hypothetical protein
MGRKARDPAAQVSRGNDGFGHGQTFVDTAAIGGKEPRADS